MLYAGVTSACRICAGTDNLKISIFESVGGEVIVNMIMSCCHPITVSDRFDIYYLDTKSITR